MKKHYELLRQLLFQVHLWTGFGLGLYNFVVGVTGSAMVFREELEPMFAAHPAVVTSDLPRFTYDELRDHLEQAIPSHRVEWLLLPDQPSKAVEASMAEKHSTRIALVELGDGRILQEKRREATFFGFLQELRFNLLGGELSGKINGIGATFLALLCLTGLETGGGRCR